VVRTRGFVPWLIRLATRSLLNHAFVFVSDGLIIEAERQGAVHSRASKYGSSAIVTNFPLTTEQAARVATEANKVLGTPYGFLDIAVLGLLSLGLRWKWLQNSAQQSGTLICSQLVDRVYRNAGIHLYDDGRPDGEVTPGDLLLLLAAQSTATELP
jgi:cell wall-associated NlpC family hydrolase